MCLCVRARACVRACVCVCVCVLRLKVRDWLVKSCIFKLCELLLIQLRHLHREHNDVLYPL